MKLIKNITLMDTFINKNTVIISVRLSFYVSLILFAWGCNDRNEMDSILLEKAHFFNPSCKNCGEPNLHVSNNGIVYLSWLSYANDSTDVLMYSTMENNDWSKAVSIARGSDWFVNWADFPSMSTFKNSDENLVAHWLQKSDMGTYDYDVRIAQSQDSGNSWNTSFIPHRDSISAEHGFVSMLPISKNRMLIAWLDGRNTKGHEKQNDTNDHVHHGAMTLRTAEFDKDDNISNEVELDVKVCDCCQTGLAMTDKGPVVVYRDRSDKEIRDISIVRRLNNTWSSPKSISDDGWQISGCPVNGPAIDALDNIVAVSWYTQAEGKAKVKLAFSSNSGADFAEPIIIDQDNPLGRVDVVLLNESEAIVSWIEQENENAFLSLVKVSKLNGLGKKQRLIKSSSSRQSGFPRMVKKNNSIMVAWTQVDSTTSVNTALLKTIK